MGLDPASRARFNLSEASILLLDATPMGLNVLTQILAGFGARALHPCLDVPAAKALVRRQPIDLAIVDSLPPRGEGYEFVRWLRRHADEPARYIPVVMTTAHTPRSQVSLARDCGAHITIKKPYPPVTLLERIVWSAAEGRTFLAADDYVGPDRRFHNLGPPDGTPGRRRDDEAVETWDDADDIEVVGRREALG
jgi:CheY-like chemotaxis protein